MGANRAPAFVKEAMISSKVGGADADAFWQFMRPGALAALGFEETPDRYRWALCEKFAWCVRPNGGRAVAAAEVIRESDVRGCLRYCVLRVGWRSIPSQAHSPPPLPRIRSASLPLPLCSTLRLGASASATQKRNNNQHGIRSRNKAAAALSDFLFHPDLQD